jgi:hypothetical protein
MSTKINPLKMSTRILYPKKSPKTISKSTRLLEVDFGAWNENNYVMWDLDSKITHLMQIPPLILCLRTCSFRKYFTLICEEGDAKALSSFVAFQ